MIKHFNTVKTIFGFIRATVSRRLPFLSRNEKLKDIHNYLNIENLYATSGQPSESQFQLIRDAGYQVVINLAPQSIIENAVIEEKKVLQCLGIRYVHIPVDFKNPTEEDFQSFVANVDRNQKTWVHCAANMRVSAFTYRYRTQILGEDETDSKLDLQKIWEPVGVWAEFIKR